VDIVVLGAGSAGLTASIGLAKAGKKVVLVERSEMGGECTNSGCIPSKALLHIAKSYAKAHHLAGETEKTKSYKAAALTYVREKISEIRNEESPEKVSEYGVEVVKGEAKFISPCNIEVNGKQYSYKKAVVATGSSPRLIPLTGVSETDILTNENLFELPEMPKNLLIIGSGPIGMEMGQAFALLGSKVTIATIDSQLGAKEDPAIRPLLEKSFTEAGIEVLYDANFKKAENKEAIFETKENSTVRVSYDKVLLAIGRVPNLPAGLEVAKIKNTKHGIEIDSQYRTSNRSVYAVGDISLRDKFTHTASDSARQVVAHILSKGWLRSDRQKAVPKVTYTEPEVAQVGMSYTDALKKYGEQEIVRIEVPYSDVDRAKTDGEDGLAIVTARRVTGVVLGANIAGARAGELITTFTIAIDNKTSLWKLRCFIYAYPTYSLLIQKIADRFFALQLASLKADILYLLKKHLPKVVALIFWLGLIYTFQSYKAENGLSYKDMLLSLYDFFTMSMWGPIIFMVLYAVRPLILFPATLLTALSGTLFGFWWGIFYTILGENASANFAYSIGRFFGKDLRLEETFIGNWIGWLTKRPFESVLFMRLFYVPFDLANYGSGVIKVAWPSYALATFIGILPGLTTFVALGAAISVDEFRENGLSFNAFDPKFLALSVVIFIASLILSRWLRRFKAEN